MNPLNLNPRLQTDHTHLNHPNKEIDGVHEGSTTESGPDPRRFFSESELLYQRQFQELVSRGGRDSSGRIRERDSSGRIRELTSSPQRGVYQWKDNSPTALLHNPSSYLENGLTGVSSAAERGHPNYYHHSTPTSPVQHHGYYTDYSDYPDYAGGGNSLSHCPSDVPPQHVNVSAISRPNQHYQQQQHQRPLGFVRALEMSESLEKSGERILRQSRQSPGELPIGVPMGKGSSAHQSPLSSGLHKTNGSGNERASVYDMNYEISV